jgi:hypothetical protein
MENSNVGYLWKTTGEWQRYTDSGEKLCQVVKDSVFVIEHDDRQDGTYFLTETAETPAIRWGTIVPYSLAEFCNLSDPTTLEVYLEGL